MATKVFIIHAKSMEIRKQHIGKFTDLLDKAKIDYEYIDEYEPGVITQGDIQTKVQLTKNNTGDIFDELVRNMHVNQLSNTLKHGCALEKAKDNKDKYAYFLFVEDDILFGDDVMQKLAEVTVAFQNSDSDILFLGLPSLSPIENKDIVKICPTTTFYKLFPCCDSYMIKSSNIEKIVGGFYPIKFVNNFQLSYVVSKNNFNTSMSLPNIFLDGSKYGAFLSSVDSNNRMMFNPEFIQLTNLLQSEKHDDKTIESAFDTIKFKNHPDVMHLNAIYLITRGEFKKASTLLDNILQISTQNNCIVNSETEFLKTYMRLYRFIQE